MHKKIVLLFAFLFIAALTFAQKSNEQLGGVYYAYPVTQSEALPAPAGYEPFYISHYGRHGSRWLPNDERYEWVLACFADTKNLTPLGMSVRRRMQKVWKNARGNGGLLTPLGARQHQGIAERMVSRFPEVFAGDDARLWARSSTVDRCRKSMLAFTGRLRELCPSASLDVATNEADMAWLVDNTPEVKALERRTRVQAQLSPERFMHSLFKDPSKVFAAETSSAEQLKLLSELFTIATDMQDVELKVNLFDVFTREEMQAVYEANNLRMTICNGRQPQSDGIPARAAITLWQNIVADADAMIASGGHGAALRFGHDTNLYRLLSLLQLLPLQPGVPDRMDEILPMAANLQMVFYKKKGETPTDSTTLVMFLHNETRRPIPSPLPDREGSDYSTWRDVKTMVSRNMHRLEHMRQLCALNTMVGTDQANTQTAGLFGKGSEEHGQTLPAVLAPNGQNFWTPQTRDTEQKCIAPYYYADTLFQGIRNSHWIVGGCTQDYGSFTVAAISGKLRTRPVDRATRFSHQQEISHPHYYAVRLPDEHLFIELTGASHTAMMRITPEKDQPIHIVVNHNSDEGEGQVSFLPEAPSLRSEVRVELTNPVHRIYQGWGESAGFSGHFLLQCNEDVIDKGSDSTCIWMTIQGKAYQPILLTMASSFTDREGCERNLAAEAAGKTFEQMQAELVEKWIERLHTIDIDDPDTARVDQFYGALYRASFLPREFSDVDGRFPRFASPSMAESQSGRYSLPKGEGRAFFTDFSLWDTYRAVHPLYNIIAPSLSSQMVQSLVTMAEQGGWMPIFPCWNSYTAAMIGDHTASVIADAYVKGITDVDYATAYRYLRQNAFDSPTPEQYKNGMGRRALQSYLKYGFIPLEDKVPDAFHTEEQTSRTLEYAYDDFCVAQLARDFGTDADYRELMRRSGNWRNVINPKTGWADGRLTPLPLPIKEGSKHSSRSKKLAVGHSTPSLIGRAGGESPSWLYTLDLTHRQPFITEGAICHYTWYVPHDVPELIEVVGGAQRFEEKLDSMFEQGLYWHGNEPCHQIAYLYNYIGRNDKTQRVVRHILDTEYNDTPGGLSGNDDAGQMSAWYIFSSLGFYPVCPGTPYYQLAAPTFRRATINLENGRQFVIQRPTPSPLPVREGSNISQGTDVQSEKDSTPLHIREGQGGGSSLISHSQILQGGTISF